jgi:outer membrane murein-binding lipoprotein Lpp
LENIIDELEKDQRKLRNQNSDATKEAEEARAKLDSLKDSHE